MKHLLFSASLFLVGCAGALTPPYASLDASIHKDGRHHFGFAVNDKYAEQYGGFQQTIDEALPKHMGAKGLCPDGWIITDSQELQPGLLLYTGHCK